MTNYNLTFTTTLLLLIVFTSCKSKTQQNESLKNFKHVDVNITINGELNIQNCANWYINFSRIKRTVVYKEKVICVGLNGGFACLNRSDLKQDTIFEKKLNTDFFTNAAVFQDTLFAEKFDKIFFWNTDQWAEYPHPLPIRYFDLLFEDKTYIFYSSCMGEFGSILFAYNKTTKETKGELTTCPNSVLKTGLGYYVGVHLYHMHGWSNSYTIKNIEKLKIIPASMRNERGVYHADPRYSFLKDTSAETRNNHLPFKFFYPKDIMIVASFDYKGKMYHFVDAMDYKKNGEQRFIGTVSNDTLRIIDSMENCAPATTFQFENTSIINEDGQWFTMIRNDTIFKITFTTLHPNYQGPKLEGYNFSTNQSKKPTSIKEYTFNYPENDDLTLKPGQHEREIKFKLGNKYKVVSIYDKGHGGNYIYINNKKSKLKLSGQWNFIRTIFTYDDRLFIFFSYLGLIELKDIDKFVQVYKE
jgi:hypothetical protein